MEYEAEGPRPKRTWTKVVKKGAERMLFIVVMQEAEKRWLMSRIDVSE